MDGRAWTATAETARFQARARWAVADLHRFQAVVRRPDCNRTECLGISSAKADVPEKTRPAEEAP